MTSARPSSSTFEAILRSCTSSPRVASSSSTTTSAKSIAWSASDTDSFSSLSCTRALAHPRRIDQPHLANPAFGIVPLRSEEHTSELQSLMRISYAVFCLTTKQSHQRHRLHNPTRGDPHTKHQDKTQ